MTPVSSPKHQLNDPGGMGAVPYIPLSQDDPAAANGEQSIGKLVSDATQHLSTLVRAEVELAKSELVGEAKKAVKGSIFFVIALVVALYSSFFFFFFLGELLSEWLQRWAAFGIVFLLMLAFAGLCGFLGYLKVRKIRAPERTISSVKDTAAALKPRREAEYDLPAVPDDAAARR
ncbi:phage holin family protein [Amycolatopsis anabasis]|uniref:phage holin family protein n=1 Tax=Amycolatopsis anabasis TaxID=1840409 RepID=UPI0015D412B3|nr:phage holin family protein [Amycolatopsis anabasis]